MGKLERVRQALKPTENITTVSRKEKRYTLKLNNLIFIISTQPVVQPLRASEKMGTSISTISKSLTLP